MVHLPTLLLLAWTAPASADAAMPGIAAAGAEVDDARAPGDSPRGTEAPDGAASEDAPDDEPSGLRASAGAAASSAVAGAAVMACAGPWLMVPPLMCAMPAAGAALGVAGALTAWAVASVLGRRAALGGLLLTGAGMGLLGGVASSVFAGLALGLLGLGSTVPASIIPWVMLGGAPLLLLSAAAWVAAAATWGVLAAVLVGPWGRARMPWESAWNFDLLKPPEPVVLRPSWDKDLQRRERQPGWDAPEPPAPKGAPGEGPPSTTRRRRTKPSDAPSAGR
jgi:hypothetical protein